ncbi:MAG: ABC transporter permease [Acidobacteriota bacterium]
MSTLMNEVKYAIRRLIKNPGFTFLAVLTLALGIGLNSAVFSVVNAVLFRPLPVADPEELVNVYTAEREALLSHAPMAFPDYLDLQQQNRSFSQLAAYTSSGLALEHGETHESILGEVVSGNYFELLGVEPALGRLLTVEDDAAGDPQSVVVISHDAWQRRLGGDPEILGRELRINGHRFTVVGVAAPSFFGMMRGVSAEVWLPIRLSSAIHAGSLTNFGQPTEGLDRLDDRARRWHFVVGRLAPGVSLARAEAEIEAFGSRLREDYPDTHETRTLSLLPTNRVRLWPGLDQGLYTASLIVMSIVALVLLIACANLANMLLARAVARRKEMATRLALGASRGAVIRQLLAESLALALAGGAAGLLLAVASNFALSRVELPIPAEFELGLALDARVVLFALLASGLSAVVFGLAPAFEATRTNLASALGEEARGSSSGRARHRVRNALVVAQVAMSLVLLIYAGLAVRSMGNAQNIDPGFDADRLVVANFSPERQGYSEAQTKELFLELQQRLEERPEIEQVTFASHLPLTLSISSNAIQSERRVDVPVEEWPVADFARIDVGYFEALGIELARGRVINRWDTAESSPIVVVNETLAARLWPGADAVGQRLRIEDSQASFEVVGVVRDGKYRTLGEAPRAFYYRPIAQDWLDAQAMIVRTRGDQYQTLATIRGLVHELDDDLAISSLTTAREATSSALIVPRAGAALFGLFGMVGVLLAAVGIYAVVSYLVSQRTHEIGIRMAMGARSWSILRLVAGEGLVLIGCGIALGLLLASVTTSALAAMLYGISATDTMTFGGVSLFLVSIGLVASLAPAYRASRLDPLVALHRD